MPDHQCATKAIRSTAIGGSAVVAVLSVLGTSTPSVRNSCCRRARSPAKRYAVSEGQAFCAQQHGCDVWHGYPIGWVAVPVGIRKQWLDAGRVRRRDIQRNWD